MVGSGLPPPSKRQKRRGSTRDPKTGTKSKGGSFGWIVSQPTSVPGPTPGNPQDSKPEDAEMRPVAEMPQVNADQPDEGSPL